MINRFRENSDQLLSLISLTLVFLCFFYIEYHTPMQCDDFWYATIGLSLKNHVYHYMSWSGRFFSDYLSCALLQIRNHAVVSCIIAFFATGLCFLIAAIPIRFGSDPKTLWWRVLCVTSFYWIANPQIEDSTFWVVGSCNYVVTTFFVMLFLFFHNDERLPKWLLFVLALLAGCSNENTAMALIYLSVVISIIFRSKKFNPEILNLKNEKIIFAGLITGAAILLLAPGNFERMQAKLYHEWTLLSSVEKLNRFLEHSSDWIFALNPIFLFYTFLLVICGVFGRNNRNQIRWSLLFASTAVVSYVVMITSPYFPARSLIPCLCFLLLAASFLLDFNFIPHKIVKWIYGGTVVFVFFTFVQQFVQMVLIHKSIMIQDQMLNEHIEYVKKKTCEKDSVELPQRFVIRLGSKLIFPFEFMPYEKEARWHGLKKLRQYPIYFDFSIVKTEKNIPFTNKTKLKDLKLYFRTSSVFVSDCTLVLESSKPIDRNLQILCIDKKSHSKTILNFDHRTCELSGRYFRGLMSDICLDLKSPIIVTEV